MPVGLIGGATAVHPTAKANVKLLGVKSARELGEVLAAVGLAQNFAALRALATEGIQRGHMELHARNLAASAGARPEEIDPVVARLIAEHAIRFDRAKEILEELRAVPDEGRGSRAARRRSRSICARSRTWSEGRHVVAVHRPATSRRSTRFSSPAESRPRSPPAPGDRPLGAPRARGWRTGFRSWRPARD